MLKFYFIVYDTCYAIRQYLLFTVCGIENATPRSSDLEMKLD